MQIKRINKKRKKFSAKEFGAEWPFIVKEGVIIKTEYGSGILAKLVFKCREGKFALNGIATNAGVPPIEPIWADHPDFPGFRKSLTPLLLEAAKF